MLQSVQGAEHATEAGKAARLTSGLEIPVVVAVDDPSDCTRGGQMGSMGCRLTPAQLTVGPFGPGWGGLKLPAD